MKLAIFALLCALHLVAFTCGAAIFENAKASQAGYAYAAPSEKLLYPSNVPSAPNRAAFDVRRLENEQPQYGRIQDAPQQQLSQELHTRNDEAQQPEQQPLIQQQFNKQQQQEVLTAKGVSALQAVAFSSHATEPKEKVVIGAASHNGYDYNRPGTAFAYPNEIYELGDPSELEQNFQHQEVASKHKSSRRGPVKRVRLNKSSSSSSSSVLRVNAVSTCNEHSKHWKTVVAERNLKRPPGRRLILYTESPVDESYFFQ